MKKGSALDLRRRCCTAAGPRAAAAGLHACLRLPARSLCAQHSLHGLPALRCNVGLRLIRPLPPRPPQPRQAHLPQGVWRGDCHPCRRRAAQVRAKSPVMPVLSWRRRGDAAGCELVCSMHRGRGHSQAAALHPAETHHPHSLSPPPPVCSLSFEYIARETRGVDAQRVLQVVVEVRPLVAGGQRWRSTGSARDLSPPHPAATRCSAEQQT